jgi:maleamate amidohydrolase
VSIFGREDHEPLIGVAPMLLVVDVANAWSRSDSVLCALSSEEVIHRTNDAIALFRAHDLPIVFTTMACATPDEFGPAILRRKPILATLTRDSPMTRIDRRIDFDAATDRLFTKTRSSCFSNGDLIGFVVANGIDTVVVTGMTTSGCIRATVVAAYDLNLLPVVLSDCVSDRTEAAHAASLTDMGSRYAEVMPVAHLREEFLRRLPADRSRPTTTA